MKLTSPDFNNSGNIPAKFTCDGENISPALHITDVPLEANSLALIVDDPDAPNGDWVHWLVWNISPQTIKIQENIVPIGAIQGLTDFGKNKWGGPCPPSGTHRYQFKLYALDTILELPGSTTKKQLEEIIAAHTLEESTLIGVYKRK